MKVYLDIVRPGCGLVTAPGWSGVITRHGHKWVASDDGESGAFAGEARTARAAVEAMARFNGDDPTELEIVKEVEKWEGL